MIHTTSTITAHTTVCVLHRLDNAITVLDTQGRQVRKIVRKEASGKEIEFGADLHMDKTTHNIYMPCIGVNKGVLCLTLEDEPLWFTPLEGSLGGISEIDGVLCVSDYQKGHGIQMVSENGNCKGKLLDNDILKKGNPDYLCFVANKRMIYFSSFQTDIVCFISMQLQLWNSMSMFCRE